MKFRTAIKPMDSELKLSYTDRILMVGSCFSENIGHRLAMHKFKTKINPLGIVYNPVSLSHHLDLLTSKTILDQDRVVMLDGMYYHLDFHSDIRAESRELLLQVLTHKLASYKSIIQESTHSFITLGTAFTFSHEGQVVCNCHKQPSSLFSKQMLDTSEIGKVLKDIVNSLTLLQPDIAVTFTVSPVRHTKEGLAQNQASKSKLRAAIADHELNYFPAYEIIVDDLRDYRFYHRDLIHPNEMAIDYIWEFFKQNLIEESSLELLARVESILKRLLHRPMNPDTDGHKKFMEKLKSDIIVLSKELPAGAFDQELG